MSSTPAIQVEGLTKQYRIGEREQGIGLLSEALANSARWK